MTLDAAGLDKLRKRHGALLAERELLMPQWREVAQTFLPSAGSFAGDGAGRSALPKWNDIYDSTVLRAPRVLTAGMMAGNTSPSRPWLRLTTPDSDLMEFEPVKLWMSRATRLMLDIFRRSNAYTALHGIYEELSIFGTAAAVMEPDYETMIHLHGVTAGDYAIASDSRGRVNTLMRNMEMTVEQMAQAFGLANLPEKIRAQYETGSYYAKHTVTHAITPREVRDLKKRDAKNKAFASVYFMQGHDKPLREGGYDAFPALVPRWEARNGSAWGVNCPAFTALGDARQLFHAQEMKAKAMDYAVNPPLILPASMRNRGADLLPGGITYMDMAGGGQAVRSAWEVQLDVRGTLEDIQDARSRINAAFYADLFLMISQASPADMTAREVTARHEEKLLMLGPVLERQQMEIQQPLIDFCFSQMIAARGPDGPLLGVPPQELQGMELRVEFISPMAQAQRAAGIGAVQQFVGYVGQVSQLRPEALDKLDADQSIDLMADMLGVDPSMVMGDERVGVLRADRQAQQAQAEQMQQMAMMAQPANQLAQAAKAASSASQQGGIELPAGLLGG